MQRVLVQDRFYKDPSGNVRMQRWIGNQLVEDIGSPVVFIDTWNLKSIWTRIVGPSTALVKEGPKAMVLCKERIQ